jgi:excisionase family DNA binding protein
MMRDVMTPEQVADHLQVTTETVYRLIKQRELAASKVGRAYRIRREDVDEFLVDRSTRDEVIAKLVKKVAKIGEHNAKRFPHLTSDDVLDELEAMDEARRQARANLG